MVSFDFETLLSKWYASILQVCVFLLQLKCTFAEMFNVQVLCFNQMIFLEWQIVRLVANHPHFGVTLMTADREAGQSMDSVFPHLTAQVLINS